MVVMSVREREYGKCMSACVIARGKECLSVTISNWRELQVVITRIRDQLPRIATPLHYVFKTIP